MTATLVRRRGALVVVGLLLLVVAAFPLLRASGAARQRAWEDDCRRGGGWVETLPGEQRNPLVVQTGHPHQQCRAADGRVVAERD